MRPAQILSLTMCALLSATLLRAQATTPDFLFGAPRGSVTIRGGFHVASASGDVFDFFSDTLTLQGSDFNAPVFGVDVSWSIHSRIDLLGSIDFSKGRSSSEYRDFEENDGTPILQQTELTKTPLTGSVKLYVVPKGRAISRFAYVPTKIRPYVGGGGGLMHYRLLQQGDFVDFVDLSIFTGEFSSSGWGGELHAFGGVDIRLSPRYYLSVEGRYVWANATLSGDFVGFDPVDLSGFQTTAGVQIQF